MSKPFIPRTPEERVLWHRLKALEVVTALPTGATLAEVVTKVNEVVQKLKAITRG